MGCPESTFRAAFFMKKTELHYAYRIYNTSIFSKTIKNPEICPANTNKMNYTEYKLLFDSLLENPERVAPYNDEMYYNYTKLNRTRVKRWDKQELSNEEILLKLKQITQPQHWIIITEPWCGDAAHSIPFLIKMSELNDLISYDIQLRDTEPFLIEKYLTNGTKSIPKLIVSDAHGKELFVWGPRPVGAQQIVEKMKTLNSDFEDTKIALQNWYNENKGEEICNELAELL